MTSSHEGIVVSDVSASAGQVAPDFVPPHPGSQQMPRWDAGELVSPPIFHWRQWAAFLGPGLVTGASAIGGGEWLTGPLVTAVYGGALLWFATLSIWGQVIYNTEISRYTLYCGEPIFNGKFRTLPGPRFWVWVYLLLDVGSFFPYLASTAATPVAMVILGKVPDVSQAPSLEALRIGVWNFLSGAPVDTSQMGSYEWWLVKGLGYAIFVLAIVPLIFGGKVYNSLKVVMSFKLVTVFAFLLFLAFFYSSASTWWEISTGFAKFGNVPVKLDQDLDGNGKPDVGVENAIVSVVQGRGFPNVDFSMFGILAAMAALAGTGGLTNTAVSGYTRDQGWGMGDKVGAIPSVIGGHSIKLSHVGMVFDVTRENIARFRGWYRHVLRDQLVVWMPACFLGLALPSMLSVQFLPRGTVSDKWLAAGMTAGGVQKAVGETWGPLFWYLTLLCGFLVLAPSVTTTADGFLRRWIDVFWTSSRWMQKMDSRHIGKLYFMFLCAYIALGLVVLTIAPTGSLLEVATNIYNFALGFSCWHVLAVNTILLPKELRPGWGVRIGLVLAGTFFTLVATITTLNFLKLL